MSRPIAHCQHCKQPIEGVLAPSESVVRCPHCSREQTPEFTETTSERVAENPASTEHSTLPMACPRCGKAFAITSHMVGQVVACPFCAFQTKAVAADAPLPRPSKPRFTPPPPPKPTAKEPAPLVPESFDFDAARDLDDSPLPKSSDASTSDDSAATDSSPPLSSGSEPTAQPAQTSEWLPPQYTLAEAPDAEEPEEENHLGIDTRLTRIHRLDEKVPVRSFSREEKDQRKKARVLVVSLLGGILLIVVFFVLMSLIGGGS